MSAPLGARLFLPTHAKGYQPEIAMPKWVLSV
jgi:hypothetical protein